jgi:hypothetical protein
MIDDRPDLDMLAVLGADGSLDESSDPVEYIGSLRRVATGEMALADLPTEWMEALADGIECRHLRRPPCPMGTRGTPWSVQGRSRTLGVPYGSAATG